MKKIILGFIVVIVLAIAVGMYYLLANLDVLVKQAIEQYGSEATHTAVRVDKVKINLTKGAGGISGLTIANPDGYTMPLAFSLGKISVGIDLKSLRQQPYIINEITVVAPQVFVEINKDNKTNLNELKKNLMSGMSATTQANTRTKNEAKTEFKTEPRLIIRRIIFANGDIQARVAALKNKEYKLKLPNLEMTQLGGKKGATPSELSREIIKRLTDSAIAQVKKKIIDQKLNELKARARAKIDAEKARLKQKVDTRLEQQKEKLKGRLKSLFK